MPLNCRFEELDPATREYLLGVRRANGRGAPGVYVALSDSKPVWAIIIGMVIIGVTLAFAFKSNKDAWAVAMLQTAGVLLGGWLVMFTIRRWMSTGGVKYPGRFLYFDPLNVYEVSGEAVRVTPLATVQGVEAAGSKTAPRVIFDFQGERRLSVPVPTIRDASRIEDYYSALEVLEKQRDGPWASVGPAEHGAAAVYAADEEELPRDMGDVDLDFEEVPAEPTRASRAGFGFLGLLMIPVAGLVLFAAFASMNGTIREKVAFDAAKEGGAPGLRGFLLDERNKHYRTEATQLLSLQYEAPIARLSQIGNVKVPGLRRGMIQLVESLRTSESPAVSIRVVEVGAEEGSATRIQRLKQDVADSLARSVGPELIAFADAPADKPAHLEIKYERMSSDFQQILLKATVTIRTDLSDKIAAEGTVGPIGPFDKAATGGDVNPLRNEILLELAGAFVPAPPPPPPDSGDF